MRVVGVSAVGLLLVGCTGSSTAAPPTRPPAAVTSVDVSITQLGVPPPEPSRNYELVRGASELVERIAAQPDLGSPDACPSDAGSTAELVVHRGDELTEVTVEPFGCGRIAGWGADRAGGRELFPYLLELLERQRLDTPDPGATAAPCPDPLYAQLTIYREPTPTWDAITSLDTSVAGPPYPAVSARVCRYEQTNAGPTTQRMLDASTAEALRTLVVGDLVLGRPYSCPLETPRADVIVFVDAAGGSFEVRISRANCAGIAPGGPVSAAGGAGPDLLAALDAALA